MLLYCMGMDEAGRGRNATFAIGRLCDLDDGRKRLLHHKDPNNIVRTMSGEGVECGRLRMLCYVGMDEADKDMNAAFAIGRLCDLGDGRKRLLHHKEG